MLDIFGLMQDYEINVAEIEELQMIGNKEALEHILDKAKRTVIQGHVVHLVRKTADGSVSRFDRFSTEEEVRAYRKAVLKYL